MPHDFGVGHAMTEVGYALAEVGSALAEVGNAMVEVVHAVAEPFECFCGQWLGGLKLGKRTERGKAAKYIIDTGMP